MAESVGNVYAAALFELCCERSCLDEVFEEITAVKDIVLSDENREYMHFLTSCLISGEDKAKTVESIFGKGISALTLDFLCLLAQKDRFGSITEIYSEFKAMYNKKMNILEVTAVTTQPLSKKLRQKLTDKLCAVTGAKIILKETVDKTILGGIVLKYGNSQIDGSVKTKLDKLKAQIDGVIA